MGHDLLTTRLLCIRHAQVGANVEQRWHGSTDSPLTDTGREQARRVAGYLSREVPHLRAVYTSPLVRAHDTAGAIAGAFDAVPTVVHDLREYGIGELEGERFVALKEEHRFFERVEGDLDWHPPGGESLRGVSTRIFAAWNQIATAHPGETVALVSHGAAIAAGLAVLLHGDPRRWHGYHLHNTGITEVTLQPPAMLYFNRADHLADAPAR